MACPVFCDINPPQSPVLCATTPRSGGINRLVFFSCNWQFTNILDPSEWAEGVNDGKIVITGTIAGQMPKASAIKKKVNSCAPDQAIGWDRTLTARDENAPADGSMLDFDFWQTIQNTPSNYMFGFFDCEDRFYGPIDNFSSEIAPVIDEASTGTTFWDISLMWQSYEMVQPLVIPGLKDILLGNLRCVPLFDYCSIAANIQGDQVTQYICSPDGLTLTADFIYGASYQWYDGLTTLPIPGATSRILHINPLHITSSVPPDPTYYYVTTLRKSCVDAGIEDPLLPPTSLTLTVNDLRPFVRSELGNLGWGIAASAITAYWLPDPALLSTHLIEYRVHNSSGMISPWIVSTQTNSLAVKTFGGLTTGCNVRIEVRYLGYPCSIYSPFFTII